MYNGNAQLRAAGEQIEYTPELMQEYIRCKEDILYFAEKYFKVVSIDKGEHLIELYDFQKKMLKAFVGDEDPRSHIALCSSRQIGKCCFKDTNIRLRNKKTGEIYNIEVQTFYLWNKIKDSLTFFTDLTKRKDSKL